MKKTHKYKHGSRLKNPYTIVFSTAIFCLWLMSEGNHYDDTYVREPDPVMKPVVVEVKKVESIEDKIMHYFPRNGKTMIAVAKAESHMNPNAVGYNCYYYQGKATTTPIKGGSKACKVEDRHLAWSRDCGILQLNTKAKSCPKETIDEHLQRAADLSRQQGLDAWVAYQNGAHEKHLANK